MIKLKDKTATDIFFMGRSVKKAIHKGVVIFEEKENFSDDTARQLLGKDWRMPILDEYRELINSCDWTWKTIEGINGYEVKSRSNGNSIFLSAAGYKINTYHNKVGTVGYCWCSNTNNQYNPIHVTYYAEAKSYASDPKNVGCVIRPVSETKGIDLGLSIRWAECNLGATTPTDYGDYYQWADSEIKTAYTAINNVYYIDGAYRKYNSVDKLTTLELINTDPIIQKVPLWHFVKKHFDETNKTLDIEDIDLTEEELSVLLDKLWQSEERRDIRLSRPTKKLIYKNQYLRDKVFDTIEKGWLYNIDMQILTDDVARATLGGDWRIPTNDEFDIIVSKCTRIWDIETRSTKAIGPNNNYIILPTAWRNDPYHTATLNVSRYVSANKLEDADDQIIRLSISDLNWYTLNAGEPRNYTTAVRPINYNKNNGINIGLTFNMAEKNIGADNELDAGYYYHWGDISKKLVTSTSSIVHYIDGKYRKYNNIDNLTTIQLNNTETPIQDIAFWRFIKNNFNETTHTLDTTDYDLEQEEIDAIIEKLWQVSETRTLKVSFSTYKMIRDEQRAVFESRGWSLVRQDVYQLLDANANGNTPKAGQSYVNYGVDIARDSLNQITLKGVATNSQAVTSPSYYIRTQGHKYLIGGFINNIRGHYFDGKTYETFNKSTIYEALESGKTAYVSVIIEQGVTYDDVIRPFVIDITATFANKGQEFIDSLDTADKVAKALGYDSYEAMPYFDFKPFDTAQASLANAVMALSFYDAEKEEVNDINDLNVDEDELQ